jgi:hypothetical protein
VPRSGEKSTVFASNTDWQLCMAKRSGSLRCPFSKEIGRRSLIDFRPELGYVFVALLRHTPFITRVAP